jgi:hypothetical protein
MFDYHGELYGLSRLPGEDNEAYKARLLDVYNRFPGRDKQGSLYGMSRELGAPIITDQYKYKLCILPDSITVDNAETLVIYDENDNKVEYDEIAYEARYQFGKYSHTSISYKLNGEILFTIDKDIVHE